MSLVQDVNGEWKTEGSKHTFYKMEQYCKDIQFFYACFVIEVIKIWLPCLCITVVNNKWGHKQSYCFGALYTFMVYMFHSYRVAHIIIAMFNG